jgi:hypothetical protein
MCKKQFSSFSNKYLALSMSSWIINQSESIDTNTYYCSVSFWTFENLVYEVPQKKKTETLVLPIGLEKKICLKL